LFTRFRRFVLLFVFALLLKKKGEKKWDRTRRCFPLCFYIRSAATATVAATSAASGCARAPEVAVEPNDAALAIVPASANSDTSDASDLGLELKDSDVSMADWIVLYVVLTVTSTIVALQSVARVEMVTLSTKTPKAAANVSLKVVRFARVVRSENLAVAFGETQSHARPALEPVHCPNDDAESHLRSQLRVVLLQ